MEKKQHMRKTYLGAACISFQPMILSALMLPVTAYVIRHLGESGYGQWAVATTIVAVVTVLTNLGLRGTFVRAVARDPKSAPNLLADQLGLRLALTAVAVAVAVLASLVLGYSQTVVLCTLIAATGLALTSISTTAADYLQAVQRLPMVATVNMVAGLALQGASILAVWRGAGPVGVAAVYLIGPAVATATFLLIIGRQHFPVRVNWNTRKAGALLWEARFFAVQLIVGSLSLNAEALLVPWLLGPITFGFFSAGALLANRLATIPEGLCSAAYPAMVDAHRHSVQATLRVFGKFLALILGTCIPGAILVGFLAGPVAHLLFHNRSEVCEQVMRITIWLIPIMGVQYLVGYLLSAFHKDAILARASLVASICSIVMTCIFVMRWGITGACWSMVLRYVIQLLFVLPSAIRLFRPISEPEPETETEEAEPVPFVASQI